MKKNALVVSFVLAAIMAASTLSPAHAAGGQPPVAVAKADTAKATPAPATTVETKGVLGGTTRVSVPTPAPSPPPAVASVPAAPAPKVEPPKEMPKPRGLRKIAEGQARKRGRGTVNKGTPVRALPADAGASMARRPLFTELADLEQDPKDLKQTPLYPGFVPPSADCTCPDGTMPWLTVPTKKVSRVLTKRTGKPALVVQVSMFDKPRAESCKAQKDAPVDEDGKFQWGYMIGPALEDAGVIVCMPRNERFLKEKDMGKLSNRVTVVEGDLSYLGEQVNVLWNELNEARKNAWLAKYRHRVDIDVGMAVTLTSSSTSEGTASITPITAGFAFCLNYYTNDLRCQTRLRFGGGVGAARNYHIPGNGLGWEASAYLVHEFRHRIALGAGLKGYGDHGSQKFDFLSKEGLTQTFGGEGFTRHATIAAILHLEVRTIGGLYLFGQVGGGSNWNRVNAYDPKGEFVTSFGFLYRIFAGPPKMAPADMLKPVRNPGQDNEPTAATMAAMRF